MAQIKSYCLSPINRKNACISYQIKNLPRKAALVQVENGGTTGRLDERKIVNQDR